MWREKPLINFAATSRKPQLHEVDDNKENNVLENSNTSNELTSGTKRIKSQIKLFASGESKSKLDVVFEYNGDIHAKSILESGTNITKLSDSLLISNSVGFCSSRDSSLIVVGTKDGVLHFFNKNKDKIFSQKLSSVQLPNRLDSLPMVMSESNGRADVFILLPSKKLLQCGNLQLQSVFRATGKNISKIKEQTEIRVIDLSEIFDSSIPLAVYIESKKFLIRDKTQIVVGLIKDSTFRKIAGASFDELGIVNPSSISSTSISGKYLFTLLDNEMLLIHMFSVDRKLTKVKQFSRVKAMTNGKYSQVVIVVGKSLIKLSCENNLQEKILMENIMLLPTEASFITAIEGVYNSHLSFIVGCASDSEVTMCLVDQITESTMKCISFENIKSEIELLPTERDQYRSEETNQKLSDCLEMISDSIYSLSNDLGKVENLVDLLKRHILTNINSPKQLLKFLEWMIYFIVEVSCSEEASLTLGMVENMLSLTTVIGSSGLMDINNVEEFLTPLETINFLVEKNIATKKWPVQGIQFESIRKKCEAAFARLIVMKTFIERAGKSEKTQIMSAISIIARTEHEYKEVAVGLFLKGVSLLSKESIESCIKISELNVDEVAELILSCVLEELKEGCETEVLVSLFHSLRRCEISDSVFIQLLQQLLDSAKFTFKRQAAALVRKQIGQMDSSVNPEVKKIRDFLDLVEIEHIVRKHAGEALDLHQMSNDDAQKLVEYLMTKAVTTFLNQDTVCKLFEQSNFVDGKTLSDHYGLVEDEQIAILLIKRLALSSNPAQRVVNGCLEIFKDMILPKGKQIIDLVVEEVLSFTEEFTLTSNDYSGTQTDLQYNVFTVATFVEQFVKENTTQSFSNLEKLFSRGGFRAASMSFSYPSQQQEEFIELVSTQELDEKNLLGIGALLDIDYGFCKKALIHNLLELGEASEIQPAQITRLVSINVSQPDLRTDLVSFYRDVSATLSMTFPSSKMVLVAAKRNSSVALSICNGMEIQHLLQMLGMIDIMLIGLLHTDVDNDFLGAFAGGNQLVSSKSAWCRPFVVSEVEQSLKHSSSVFPMWQESWTFLDASKLCPMIKNMVVRARMLKFTHGSKKARQNLDDMMQPLLEYLNNNGARFLGLSICSVVDMFDIGPLQVKALNAGVLRVLSEQLNSSVIDVQILLATLLEVATRFGKAKAESMLQKSVISAKYRFRSTFRLLNVALQATHCLQLPYSEKLVPPRNRLIAFDTISSLNAEVALGLASKIDWKNISKSEEEIILKETVPLVFSSSESSKLWLLKVLTNYLKIPLEASLTSCIFYLTKSNSEHNFEEIVQFLTSYKTQLSVDDNMIEALEAFYLQLPGTEYNTLYKFTKFLVSCSRRKEVLAKLRKRMILLDILLNNQPISANEERTLDFHQIAADNFDSTCLKVTHQNINDLVAVSEFLGLDSDEFYSKLVETMLTSNQKLCFDNFEKVLLSIKSKMRRLEVCQVLANSYQDVDKFRLNVQDFSIAEIKSFDDQQNVSKFLWPLELERFAVWALLQVKQSLGEKRFMEATLAVLQHGKVAVSSAAEIISILLASFLAEYPSETRELVRNLCENQAIQFTELRERVAKQWLTTNFSLEAPNEFDILSETLLRKRLTLLLLPAKDEIQDVFSAAKFLLLFVFKSEDVSYRSKCRALETLFRTVDIATINEVLQFSTEKANLEGIKINFQYFQYMMYFEKLGLPHQLKEVMKCEKLGLVKALWRDHKSNPLAMQLVVTLMIDFKLDDPLLIQAVRMQLETLSLPQFVRKLLLLSPGPRGTV